MNKKGKAIAMFVAYVVLMLADGYLTWLNTPDRMSSFHRRRFKLLT